MIASSQIVWDVRITGNETVSSRDIEQSLAACGFGVGTPLRGFRADVTENRVLMLDDRLAWISINRRGTVAYVQVREAAHAPKDDEENTAAANVVASRPGRIERVELVRGLVVVGKGDTVDEGDLLVSGLYDSLVYGYRWTHAEARVYARTVREIHISIPLTYEQRVYSAEEGIARDVSLKFFSKTIKFSKSTGNEGVLCDTIESERSMGIFSEVGFPLSVQTVWYLPYTVATATRTPAEAEELAYYELAREIASIPGGVELLQKSVTTHLGESEMRLDCTVVCIEDIATIRPIDIVQTPN